MRHLTLAALLLAHPAAADKGQLKLTLLRVRKCETIVGVLYAHEGRADFRPYIAYFIQCHERLEREGLARGDKRASGFGAAYWYSLVYGAANFSLRCYATAPGGCAGPMDVKHWPRVTDPEANIEWHCREMYGFYIRGVRGLDLCEHVFYPAAPRDWGGGRFARTERRHREVLRKERY